MPLKKFAILLLPNDTAKMPSIIQILLAKLIKIDIVSQLDVLSF